MTTVSAPGKTLSMGGGGEVVDYGRHQTFAKPHYAAPRRTAKFDQPHQTTLRMGR